MRRRDFAAGAGASALLPLGARAQQRARPRLIGALISLAQDNRQAQARVHHRLGKTSEVRDAVFEFESFGPCLGGPSWRG